MNYMPKVIEVLGLREGDKFILTSDQLGYNFPLNPCSILKGNIVDCTNVFIGPTTLRYLLFGYYKIEKILFKPKIDEEYYHIACLPDKDAYVVRTPFCKDEYHLGDLILGNCFKTYEEAKENRDKVFERFNEVWCKYYSSWKGR